jgi:hypothetical protein
MKIRNISNWLYEYIKDHGKDMIIKEGHVIRG